MRDLGALPGGNQSAALGINASGDTAGFSDLDHGNELHAVLWVQGKIRDLGVLPGGLFSEANGMNDRDEVVGFSDGNGHGVQAAIWYKNGRVRDLGTLPGGGYSQAMAVNVHGVVVGYSDNARGATHAIVWTNRTGMEDLGTLPGGGSASANSINNLGPAAGGSDTVRHGRYYCCRAALWDKDKKVVDLGTLGANWAAASAINNNGEVVGTSQWRAFLWSQEKGMRDVNHFISHNSGWTLQWATGINDHGQITGWGTINGQTHAFLLTPQDQPPWACK